MKFVFNYTGASHSDELALMFYMPWVSEIYADNKDYAMSTDLVKLWVDFAQEDSSSSANNKNNSLQFRNVNWPRVDSSDGRIPMKYLRLDLKPEIIDEPFTERIQFWDGLFEEHDTNSV
jgi:carboxylesterase type B